MRRTILDDQGVVVNVVICSDGSDWDPGAGFTLGPDGGEVGDTWTGETFARPSPPEQPLTQADYAAAIQSHIDVTARAQGYQDGFALASYATSTIPAWSTEALAFIAWRDAVWVYAHDQLALVQAAARDQPTVEGLIAELPAILWPS